MNTQSPISGVFFKHAPLRSLQAVPTLLQAIVDTEELGACTSLTRLFSGGETLTRTLAQADRDGVTGQGLMKYLMHAVDRATGGRTAQANMAVLISTAEVGGRLAAAYARHQAHPSATRRTTVNARSPSGPARVR